MGQPGIVHDFASSLKYSEASSEESFWDAIYRKAFPSLVNQMTASGDVESQRMGIDRVIVLSSGQVLRIDEKKRAKDWPDILLEYISVDTTGAPGWMEKDLFIDYLAYAFMPSKKVYLFPWLMLRRAWNNYKKDWLSTYRTICSQNNGYKTFSVAIPIEILTKAVKVASIIQLEEQDESGGEQWHL